MVLTVLSWLQPDEYEKLGSYAMIGLPEELYPTRYIKDGEMKTEYPIIIAGDNFGCGSSREHAPVSMGASGVYTSCICCPDVALHKTGFQEA